MIGKTKMLLVAAGLLAVPGLAAAQGYGSETGEPQANRQQEMSKQNAEVFKKERNFRVEGTIASVDTTSGQLMLQRSGLPPVELKIANDTEIKVNGESGTLSQLQPGDEVRAEFNLAESQPIAVSVDAKESKESKRMRESMPGSQEGSQRGSPSGQ